MPDERALAALTRIEQALARIEAAASQAPNSEELNELRQKHQTLRERVEGAVGEIDRLLAGHGRG